MVGSSRQRASPAYCGILVHFRWIEVLWQAKRRGLARFGILEGGLAAEPLLRVACNWCRVDADGVIGVPDWDVRFIQNSKFRSLWRGRWR
jgi:hypothetical protein